MLQVNDCFHNEWEHSLVLITNIKEGGSYKVSFVQLYNISDNLKGCVLDNAWSATEKYFFNLRKVSSENFFKVAKLLKLNGVACNNIVENAIHFQEGDVKVGHEYGATYVQYEDHCIGFSEEDLAYSSTKILKIEYYISLEVYNSIVEHCKSTFELISDIWSQLE